MPIWLLPSALGLAGGWLFGHSSNTQVQPDPINSLSNLIIVGTLAAVGYKIFVKH